MCDVMGLCKLFETIYLIDSTLFGGVVVDIVKHNDHLLEFTETRRWNREHPHVFASSDVHFHEHVVVSLHKVPQIRVLASVLMRNVSSDKLAIGWKVERYYVRVRINSTSFLHTHIHHNKLAKYLVFLKSRGNVVVVSPDIHDISWAVNMANPKLFVVLCYIKVIRNRIRLIVIFNTKLHNDSRGDYNYDI